MPYTPPLIKLPLLRIPAAPPYRPPGPNRLPPTQPAPIYQPSDLLPPTDIDLKGVVCIYSNAPVWEPKKIRYRYPGEAWQEISGERYSLNTIYGDYNQEGFIWVKIIIRICYFNRKLFIGDRLDDIYGPYPVVGKILGADIRSIQGGTVVNITQEVAPNVFSNFVLWSATNKLSQNPCYTENVSSPAGDISKPTSIAEIVQYIGETQCEFKVFDIFNQEILSITRDVCPEVIVIPERCYFQAENERLVRKINVSFFQTLKTEYSGNCATVLLESYPFPPVGIYKECSDNPNCPPPRIRFDKKCEEKEKCDQCPPGTTITILNGLFLLCVNSSGCVIKVLKYKPKCHKYNCICS